MDKYFCQKDRCEKIVTNADFCPLHTPSLPNKPMKNNYLQVGQITACGHCDPKRFGAGLADALKLYPDFKCDCICHSPLPNKPEEELEWHLALEKLAWTEP